MGLAALNELREIKGGGGGGGGGGGVSKKKKKGKCEKVSFFTTPFISLEPYPPLEIP